MNNSTQNHCQHILQNRDLPFITSQFTSLAYIMNDFYKFGKFEIKMCHNEFRISWGLLYVQKKKKRKRIFTSFDFYNYSSNLQRNFENRKGAIT